MQSIVCLVQRQSLENLYMHKHMPYPSTTLQMQLLKAPDILHLPQVIENVDVYTPISRIQGST